MRSTASLASARILRSYPRLLDAASTWLFPGGIRSLSRSMLQPEDYVHVLGPKLSPLDELRSVCHATGQEDAFYLCNVDDVVHKMELWRQLLPRVRPHYAVKCNASRVVLNTLAALGAGFDCASKGEIEEVLSLGVDPSRIIFAQPAKPATHIRFAAGRGINLATFDNEEELYKMRALHPKCRLVLRIRCDADDATYCLGIKYGCDAERDAPRLLRTARDLGLQVVGVSFHVGSGCREEHVYRRAVRAARHVFDVAEGLDIRGMRLLDVGGGYPGDPEAEPVFRKMAEAINSSVAEFFPSPDVDVISEPGMYFVSSAFTLAANVHSKREVRSEAGDLESVMYYINDGAYGSFIEAVLDTKRFRGVPLEAHGESCDAVPSSVWGPTCDGTDKVEDGNLLPPLELGSWLLYHNHGAYTVALATGFNGLPTPKVHAVVSTSTWSQLRDRAPFTESHFVPSLATGRRHTSASLADPHPCV
ncbi:ornithine decarboxylase 2-like isoform X3 [Frankliniella occidentalis]|uniref:ornithine decarboxylase n=1 Tax=Frankliniella occidentalis TaxID=133901 RepID=A0A9C6U4I7_FRAOC|nr:ornithine decarboxylase 2-like isoform X3 [Frankliniella occidentalis]